MNVVHRPIPAEHDELIVLNAKLRTYAAVGSKGDRYHLLQPATLADPRVGDGKVMAGALVCSCEAGLFGRTCWAFRLAIAFESGIRPDPSWLTASPTPQEVASR